MSLSSTRNLPTILSITSLDSFLKIIVASSLFLNSGAKNFLRALSSYSNSNSSLNPIKFFSASLAPRLVVRINTQLRASASLLFDPVTLPLSISCNRICDTSGCAFSISSSSNTQLGFSCSLVINCPASSSKPTYPGGEPISLAILCFS